MADYNTPRGTIHYGPVCIDNYPNIGIYHQDGGTPIKLQEPALRSFKAAEDSYGQRTKRPSGTRIIAVTGTWRSCEYQAELYEKDPSRYAPPNSGGHTRGLCIDVSMAQGNLGIIRVIFTKDGWKQSRSDEPWHFSYFLSL